MIFRFGAYELDEQVGELRHRGRPVAIQPKPFELLRILLHARDRVVPSEELFEALWPGVAVTPSSLTRAVSVARRAIGDTHRGGHLRSVARRGYRFVGDVVEIGAPPRAAAGAAAPEAAAPDELVGREAELARLHEAFGEALAGRGGVIVVSGPPGIGKSRLSERFAAECAARGARVLVGRGREGEGVPALWLWVQVLRKLLADDREGEARRALAGAVPELADLLPDLAPASAPAPLAEASPEQGRFLLFDAVARALEVAAGRRPLVVVLEDLQWAGPASIRLFEHVGLEVADAPLLVVATVRDGAGGEALAASLARVRRQRRGGEIALRGLSRGAVAAYLAGALGAAAPPDLTSELYARTEGVPLFLREAVRLLAERGELRHPERVRRWAVTLPDHVLDLIRRPLAQLSAECAELLAAAAVLGREFSLALAAAVAELPRARVLDLLDEAAGAGVVEALPEDPATWGFSHALFQEAVYAGLGAGRRVRLHARAAAALEAQCGGDERAIAELAHHHLQGIALGDPERALACAQRAAERAHRLRDFEHAAMHRAQALAALDQVPAPDPGRRLDALLALGEARGIAGDRSGRREAFAQALESARRLGRHDALVAAAIGFCDLTEWSPADEDARRALREALAAAGAARAPRAAIMTRLAYLDIREARDRAEPLAREAVALAREAGDPDLVIDACYVLHFVIASPESFAEREALTDEMRRAAPGAERPEEAVIALVDVASDRLAQGDAAGARRYRAEAARVAGERPNPTMVWHLLAYDAGLAHLEGRFADAERLNAEARLVGERIDHPYARGVFAAHRVGLARERGDAETVARLFGRGLTGRQGAADWMAAVVARAEAALGRRDDARRRFEEVARLGFDRVPRNIRWLNTILEVAHLCVDLADRERAGPLEELLQPVASLHGVLPVPVCYGGPASRGLARLVALQGRVDEAAELFEEAFASAEALGARPMAARILAEHGALLARRGSRAAARALLADAAKRAGELAMPGLADAAAAELARLGAGV
jgi:DNA-binding winged helix-turn-helix (wHTH) protein/tetratricopeptide (TPR) repeat protein